MQKAELIKHSIAPNGKTLETWVLTYPRFILSELNTHRQFSRNSASSRAIPMNRMIERIWKETAVPVYWGKNQPGMQAAEELSQEDQEKATVIWYAARDRAIIYAKEMNELGVHKQIGNRILEPFMHTRSLVSSTEWDNFYSLRNHKEAQPEFVDLARKMQEIRQNSVPTPLGYDEWHLPFVSEQEMQSSKCRNFKDTKTLIRCSVARCARVSYLTFDGKVPNVEDDLRLYDRLVGSRPLHASPAEHVARPDKLTAYGWKKPHLHGNFVGFIQHRKILEKNIWKLEER